MSELVVELRGRDEYVLQSVWDEETTEDGFELVAETQGTDVFPAIHDLVMDNLRGGTRADINLFEPEE
jgi:hypothetical protein